MQHVPVMLPETLEFLSVQPEGLYVDATTGLGGHTRAIAERLTTGRVIANDRDADSLEIAKANLAELAGKIEFHHGAFSELRNAVTVKADGLVADLGVSRYQLTEPSRGFSLMAEGPLDMRMDRSRGEPASEFVNLLEEKALADLIYQFGEERRSRRISRAIVRARPIQSTQHLARVIEEAVPRTTRLHPATQTFMALRLVVNGELDELDSLLERAPAMVKAGGRIVIITFMSLEDRKVKQSFQALARGGRARLLAKHVVRPSEEEVKNNPPSRSAKLRAIEITKEE